MGQDRIEIGIGIGTEMGKGKGNDVFPDDAGCQVQAAAHLYQYLL